jgi:hypothetical protein
MLMTFGGGAFGGSGTSAFGTIGAAGINVIPASPTSGRRDVGDSWLLAVEVRDDVTGCLSDATITATVTRPDTSTSALVVTRQALGFHTAPYVLAAVGRHTAVVAASGLVVGVATFAVDALPVSALPTLATVRAYLGSDTSATDATLSAVLAAETAAQAMACRVPAAYPADLGEALLRRVARNLAARSVPVASFSAFEGGGGEVRRVPQRDPEVARLEAPYRRLVVG